MSNIVIAVCLVLVVSVSALEPLAPINQCDVNREAYAAYSNSVVDLTGDVQTYVEAVIESKVAVEAYAKAWENARSKSLAVAETITSSQCVEASVTALAVAGADATTAAYASIEVAVRAKAKASASLQVSAFAYGDAFSGSCTCPQTSDFSESADYLEAFSDLDQYARELHVIYESASATAAAFAEALAGSFSRASACL